MSLGRVLVVDDEPVLGHLLEAALWDAGYAVRVAPDGAAGLGHITPVWRPDVILLDLVMPRATGWDFVPAYRARWGRRAAIFVMTAAGPGAVRAAHTLDVEEILVKPLHLDHLLELVATHLAQRRRLRLAAS